MVSSRVPFYHPIVVKPTADLDLQLSLVHLGHPGWRTVKLVGGYDESSSVRLPPERTSVHPKGSIRLSLKCPSVNTSIGSQLTDASAQLVFFAAQCGDPD